MARRARGRVNLALAVRAAREGRCGGCFDRLWPGAPTVRLRGVGRLCPRCVRVVDEVGAIEAMEIEMCCRELDELTALIRDVMSEGEAS